MKAIKFFTILKWVGYATAILSLLAGIREAVKLIADRVETRRKVDALLSSQNMEMKEPDYWFAWRTLDQASQLSSDSAEVHAAQENVAMVWLENIRLRENERFSDITEKLEPVLTRGVASTKESQRSADLLAHLGWSYFLRTRDGLSGIDPVDVYSKAVARDPNNSYAQAMWGHWILWNRGRLSDASQHFSSALSSGRRRDFARRLQLAALIDCRTDACAEEIFRVTNDIRKEHSAVDPAEGSRIFSNYYGQSLLSIPASGPSVNAIPASEHLETFRWLFDRLDFDDSKSLLRTYDLAVLQEAAGQQVEALANYRFVRSKKRSYGGSLFDAADKGVKRLSPAL